MLNSFGEFANGSVAPRTRIYRNAQPNLIDAWLLELLRGAHIGDRFYLRTGLEYFPWADCRVLDHRWLESLRRVMGTNQGYIAHDKNSAVMTIGTQYEVLGFVAGSGSAGEAEVAPAPVEEVPTRRIVTAPAASPEPQPSAALSGDLRARRLAALSADGQAAAATATPGAALASMPDLPATPSSETASAPQVIDAEPAPPAEAEPAPETAPAEPAEQSTAPADDAPTQYLTRIVVPTDAD
ncbi:hypothetical protein GPX89_07155 [Nocardia sp. ET3-3]|uniref:Uncharacterized protein n=1 Tax=Nocardia terrae TaxID=2675851 RepID=A0A7K1URS2_9NOCA|nr:hypothetical protein [Nocardia terrae]MVU77024.1 hypothetical protein [Nocardia terrae]